MNKNMQLILLLSGLLWGCGSDNDPSPSTSPSSSPSTLSPDITSSEPEAPPRQKNETPATTPPGNIRIEDGPERITLRTDYGHVEIKRAPLSMSFYDGNGNKVLSSDRQQPPVPLLLRTPLPSRLLGGWTEIMPEAPALYAPFTFVVGDQLNLQFPATFWVGNMLASASTGVEFRLTNVQGVSVDGNQLSLDVGTSDPSGRKARVTIKADENSSFHVSVKVNHFLREVPLISASFDSRPDEAFRGFGGRRNKINQRNEAFLNWAEEFSQTPEELEPLIGDTFGDHYQFPSGPQGAYYIQSLFVSDQGYGFMLDRDELSHWRMASDRSDAWRVEVAGSELDFLVVPGNQKQVVSRLSGINGRHRVPPRWSLGPMLSETIQEFTDTPENYTEKVKESLDQIEALELPVTAFAFEGWVGTKKTGAFDDIIQRLRAQNIKPITYYRGFVGQAEDELEEPEVYQQALSRGYVTRHVSGLPYLFGSPLMGGIAALIDFTNPQAVEWWKERIKKGLEEGSEGFMQDFGEQVQVDMVFHDGSSGIAMHNRNAELFHQATREAFDEFVADNPDREPWFFVRFGNSGRKGSAHYESASWPGDNTADWSRASGLGSVIPDMLNRSVGGAYGFVTEIGGYIDTFGSVDSELLIRWANHASLMPVFRQHGGPVNGTPMPWRFDDPEVVEHYRAAMNRHIAAQPLIYHLWQEALATGIPITRPLWLEYPNDPEAGRQEQQFMLGPNVLVAPVVSPGTDGRDVYFPRGCWQHPETKETVLGPQTKFILAAVNELPYFFNCGTEPFPVPEGGF
ncbi:TIM-barrel domain-containing protein [Alcanivorax jadensis]|uniref:TIM-barrel domain-containing protein n=1 Tax=Alcanivorax jadensis TaxID=64988 RepID=UPI003567672F